MRRKEPRIHLDPWAAEYEGAIQEAARVTHETIGRVAVIVRSPFPAWATRKTEVAARVPEPDVFKGFTDD